MARVPIIGDTMYVKAIVSNRQTIFPGLAPHTRELLSACWSFQPPGYQWMPKYKFGQWDGWIRMMRYGNVPTGLFLATKAEIEKEFQIQFDCEYRCEPVHFSGDIRSDRPYQVECVKAMQKAAQTGGGLVIAATGSGKTRSVGMLFRTLHGSAVFVVDELTLLEQAREMLESVLEEPVGKIGESEFRPQRITVATVQTLYVYRAKQAFLDWARKLTVMVVDEVHLALNYRQLEVLRRFQTPTVFGLTATLELQKHHVRMQAYALTGPVCFQYSLAKGKDQGYLAGGACVQVCVKQNIGAKNSWNTDYKKIVVSADDRNELIAGIVREALDAGRSVVVLVQWVSHIRILTRLLADIPHRLIHGDVDVRERVMSKKKFNKGDLRLIIASSVFKKGIDLPRIDCIIEASSLKSRNDTIQKFGRGVRNFDGKDALVYFDIGDIDNRFEESADSRRSALLSAGIPVRRIIWGSKIDLKKLVSAGIKFAATSAWRKQNGKEGETVST